MLYSFVNGILNTFLVRLSLTLRAITLDSRSILATFLNELHVFVIVCLVYLL